MTETLPIVFQDEHLIAINKPSGLLVHRSPIDRHETRFAVQILRDQINQHVFPIHRLDKPTSGILLFALNADIARALSADFAEHRTQKQYLALCRGHLKSQVCDHPLTIKLDRIADKHRSSDKAPQTATTELKTLATCELPFAVDKYPVSHYSIALCLPKTGRKHQIRRHLKHTGHPIVGDAKHGKSKHNHFFAEQFAANHLLLSAVGLAFSHPVSGERIELHCNAAAKFIHAIEQIQWHEKGWQENLPAQWLRQPLNDQ